MSKPKLTRETAATWIAEVAREVGIADEINLEPFYQGITEALDAAYEAGHTDATNYALSLNLPADRAQRKTECVARMMNEAYIAECTRAGVAISMDSGWMLRQYDEAERAVAGKPTSVYEAAERAVRKTDAED